MVLAACEFSGRVRDAFTALGHDAISCDILPSEGDQDGKHYQGSIWDLEHCIADFDLVIAFPPCTYLSKVGVAHWKRWQADGRQQEAIEFVRRIADWPVARLAIENPVGKLSTSWRKPDQYIQPWQYGDPWKKETCLWLKGLPPLQPTNVVEPVGHWIDGGKSTRRPGRTGHAEGARHSQKERGKTFPGIAQAMADQWGVLVLPIVNQIVDRVIAELRAMNETLKRIEAKLDE